MDKESLRLVRKVWKHSGRAGNVWMPSISKIGKPDQRFMEGKPLNSVSPVLPQMNTNHDWYWTPAVSSDSRQKGDYPAQNVVWVDCDESYDDELLTKLRPTYIWETSPGHKQAIWLMKEPIEAGEFHKNGFMGMLTQALGGDKSGVDIGQLLRVPGTVHHKGKPFTGKILRSSAVTYTKGQLLTRVARGLGFSPGLSSELGADDPYGDRSKKLWQFARSAAELGLTEELAFKLLRACKWNKWKDDNDRLREDISRAYSHSPEPVAKEEHHEQQEDEQELSAWDMETVEEFGPVIHAPLNWVLPGIIPEAGCGLLVSAPKVGKTRVAIEVALGIATGLQPLGIDVRKQTNVGFFSLEDGEYLFSTRMNNGLNKDEGRFQYHWDGHITEDLVWEPATPMPLFSNFNQVDLSGDEDKQRLYETILKYELKLVVIDTLSMSIGKADVSSSTDMYAILKDIKVIAKETGCAVMFIHHTRKRVFDKGESIQEMVLGSTALHAWSDFILNLAPPKEDDNLLRLGVQTKMGSGMEYVGQDLKIIKRPTEEPEHA